MKTAPQAVSHVPHPPRAPWRLRMLAAVMGCGLALHYLPAQAARPVDDVTQLLEQGKADQAAKQADAHLQQNPTDVEMRFLRGVIATEQKQNAQAIKIFSALTREYPNMPEPYNNLAVLYAAEGQERKAAEALEQAIRTNPSYSTAHENLGDLYARMASDAYSKALQLDGARQEIRPKLALITQIVPGAPARGKTMVADAAATPARAVPAPAPVAVAKVEAAPAKPAVEAKSEPKAEAKPDSKPVAPPPAKPEPVVVAKAEPPVAKPVAAPVAVAPTPAPAPAPAPAKAPEPEPKKPEPAGAPAPKVSKEDAAATAKAAAPAPKPVQKTAAADVERAVHAWAKAWEGKDMPAYLDAYSDKFSPAGGGSLAAWKESRRQRIVGKQSINVDVRNLQVTVDGDQATAKFRQHYTAGSLNTATRKTLVLQHEKGGWHIVRETTGG